MPDSRPNILLLVGEDVGLHLGCYGDKDGSTPHLDRFAAEGCRFDQAISTAPVCAPSRSSVVTGRYPWSLGTHHMRSTLLNPPRLFTHELRDAGYYVNWQNKTDFNFQPAEDFADDHSDWLSALRAANLPDKPFLLYRNFGVTHESTMWGEPSTGGEEGASRARKDNDYLLGPGQRHDPGEVTVPPYLPDAPQVRDDLARYYDALSIEDAQVGEVLAALEASPYAENTIVIYMSDHGRGLVREKRWCYDAGVHMPLLIRWPGQIEPGTTSDELINWVDIAPTLLSVAGVAIPEHYQGQVFLGPGKAEPRSYAFAGRDRMDEAFDRVRACRNDRYHYICNFYPQLPYCQRNGYMEHQLTTRVVREWHADGQLSPEASLWMAPTKPAEELYDIHADKAMVRNLADDPAHADALQEMRDALTAFLEREGDLGEVSERTLIERGLVKDQLDEYHQRVHPLPERYRVGVEQSLVEMEEAEAFAGP